MPERKFIPLSELKVSSDGAGTIEGYRAVFGEIDSGGDLIVPGAFKDCIPTYLNSGFTAESHDWDFGKSVGFPIEAKEDAFGWFVKSQFHSTPDAQNIRTKAKERMDAGKQVGFSFGYKTDDYQLIEQKDFKDQLPQFIKADRLEENMKKAQAFSRIRILKKVSAIEDSLVTSPMNKLAGATSVKSESKAVPTPETKGIFEDVIEEREEQFWFLTDTLSTALWRARSLASQDSGYDKRAAFTLILAEFGARLMAAEFDPEELAEGGDLLDTEMMADNSPISFKGDHRGGLPFAKNVEMVLGAVEAFAHKGAAIEELAKELTERRKKIIELRESKAGAMYSSANAAHMQRVHDALGKVKKSVTAVHADMGALISKATPSEKSDAPELDTQALRTQSLRAQTVALQALN